MPHNVDKISPPTLEFSNKKALKGLALGLLALKATSIKRGGLVDRVALRAINKDSTIKGRTVSGENTANVEKVFHKTAYWHGTGRYQYRDGEVMDVLKGMLKQGGLAPQPDDIDTVGPMESVSMARSRTYARAYADMHQQGEKGKRHGSALLWSSAFIGPLAFKIIKEEKVWRKENRVHLREHFAASNSAQWYRKVREEPTGTLGAFAYGSDINNNYPMLFGVKEGVVEPAHTSMSVAVHEVRSTKPISFSDLTHIEVPEVNVAETQTLLEAAGYDVPVLSIEDFESYAAKQSFKQLVS